MSILFWVTFSSAVLFRVLILFSSPLERQDLLLKWAGGVLAGLTFIVGFGAIITGIVLGDQQAEKIRSLDKDVADARTKQKEAELAYLELQDAVLPRSFARHGNIGIINVAQNFRGTKVAIKYVERCTDCKDFATEIAETLRSSGWSVLSLMPGDHILPVGLSIGVGLSKNSGSEVPAAIALTEELLKRRFDLRFWYESELIGREGEIPPDAVSIEVSPNPIAGVLTDEERRVREARLDSVRRNLEFTRQQFDLLRQRQD